MAQWFLHIKNNDLHIESGIVDSYSVWMGGITDSYFVPIFT